VIILDTNVVSEPMRSQGDPAVTAWLDVQAVDALYITAVSVSELMLGIELLPAGKRKHALRVAMTDIVARLFGPRILAFDRDAAFAYATIVSRARAGGFAIHVADGQIAAIAAIHDFTVATRDTAPFKAAGVPVVDPWTA